MIDTKTLDLAALPSISLEQRKGECNVTEEQVREFGQSIGITIPPYRYHPANDQYDHAGNILHELGHWAVVPQFIIDWQINLDKDSIYRYLDITLPGNIPAQHYWAAWYMNTQLKVEKPLNVPLLGFPDIDWENPDENNKVCSAGGSLNLLTSLPIPTEWGVQEWCKQVKHKLGWVCRTSYWDTEDYPIHRDDQLWRVGINVDKGIFRPTITRIDMYKYHWRMFSKNKLICKQPIMINTPKAQANIIGFDYTDQDKHIAWQKEYRAKQAQKRAAAKALVA